MKILVTGGTGFTGSCLVRYLLQRGHEVVALDNQEGIVLDELKRLGAKFVKGSVTDPELLKEVIPGCDAVYHLAAAFRRINLPQKVYMETNATAMRALLTICRDNGVKKFIYCSTQGVHGNIDDPPGDEDSPIEPEDYYQYTKYKGEEVAQEFIAQGMDITILRPTALYGPGDPSRFLMIFRQVKKGWFPYFGKGGALYHPVYVESFCESFELARENPASKGQTYIIADGEYYPIREIVGKVADIMGIKVRQIFLPFWPMYILAAIVELIFKPLPWDPPLFRRRVDWYRQNRAFKIDKARRELNYEPKVGLDEGLKITYEWYKANGFL